MGVFFALLAFFALGEWLLDRLMAGW